MLGLGESIFEVRQVLVDLRAVGCEGSPLASI
jgi:lipoate synthase